MTLHPDEDFLPGQQNLFNAGAYANNDGEDGQEQMLGGVGGVADEATNNSTNLNSTNIEVQAMKQRV